MQNLDLLDEFQNVEDSTNSTPEQRQIETWNKYVLAFNELIALSQNTELTLTQFLSEFGDSLFDAVTKQNQPVYTGQRYPTTEAVFDGLARPLFEAQKNVARACLQLLMQEDKPAAIINAEMGSGKTIMAIATAAAIHKQGLHRCLVLSPPHLVYKWRREILKTVPEARVWILNGTDTLSKLIRIKQMQHTPEVPEFYILGRVRMRMGYNWRPAFAKRQTARSEYAYACCPRCGGFIPDSEGYPYAFDSEFLQKALSNERRFCERSIERPDGSSQPCGEPFWTLCRKDANSESQGVYERVLKAIQRLPAIGPKKAEQLVQMYGADTLAEILENNVQAFSNLMDERGDFIFTDRQAVRLDRALSRVEFSLGQGGYQPTEFIKRYLPKNFFGLMVIDEGHEYKNYGTAQGQAMGVLARCVRKTIALTGTLMGGYADDLFYLLWRLYPEMFIEDGFGYNKQNTLGTASMAFMREHGVLKEITRHRGQIGAEYDEGSFSSAKASRNTVRIAKAPGFSPLGIMRFVLPITVFLKLRDLGENILPPYTEHFNAVYMTSEQSERYETMQHILTTRLKQALSQRDNTLTGVVTSALLSWPDCCFEEQQVYWKKEREVLFNSMPMFEEDEPSPKEQDMLDTVKEHLAKGRKSWIFTTYSDTKDTTVRLKKLLELAGIKTAVLRASVKADTREDWVSDQLDDGIQVIISNPELVKTGLDLLEFPTIYFMQTGYNVYTVMQAARRSWRIGQKDDIHVYFAGYVGDEGHETAQQICLELMSKKIAVSQSTSGDMPDTGLDILNQSEDSIEVALAKKLVQKN